MSMKTVLQALLPVIIVIIPFGSLLFVNTYLNFPILFQMLDYLGKLKPFNHNLLNYFTKPRVFLKINISGIDLFDLLFLFLSFHATLHAISLLVTTPAFRIKFYEVSSSSCLCIRNSWLILSFFHSILWLFRCFWDARPPSPLLARLYKRNRIRTAALTMRFGC